MAEEHLEAAASGQAEGWFEQRKDPGFRKRQDASLFQTITLVMLPFIWAGFVYSLVTGNESNMNGYSLMILFFSLQMCIRDSHGRMAAWTKLGHTG